MKILIVKTSALGDIVQSYPVIDYLKRCQGVEQIDWIVEKGAASLVERHPDIDRVLTIDTKKWRKGIVSGETWREFRALVSSLRRVTYDLAIDLQGNVKSGILLGCAKAQRKAGYDRSSVPEAPNLMFTRERYGILPGHNIREDYLNLVKQCFRDSEPFIPRSVQLKVTDQEMSVIEAVLRQANEKRIILVFPGSRWMTKQLPESDLLKCIHLLHLQSPTHFFLFWGAEQERSACERLARGCPESTVVDRMDLAPLQHFMRCSDGVFAMDSFPLHLAGTTPTATLSFFGASSSLKYAPLGKHHISIQGSCPYGITFEKRCPKLRTCPTGACMKHFTQEEMELAFCNSKRCKI